MPVRCPALCSSSVHRSARPAKLLATQSTGVCFRSGATLGVGSTILSKAIETFLRYSYLVSSDTRLLTTLFVPVVSCLLRLASS